MTAVVSHGDDTWFTRRSALFVTLQAGRSDSTDADLLRKRNDVCDELLQTVFTGWLASTGFEVRHFCVRSH